MTQQLTCLACGITGPNVHTTLVEYADPIPVTVHVPVSARANAIEMPRQVPGRYGAEWRCRDVVACRERAVAIEAMESVAAPSRDTAPEPVVEPVVEEASWF